MYKTICNICDTVNYIDDITTKNVCICCEKSLKISACISVICPDCSQINILNTNKVLCDNCSKPLSKYSEPDHFQKYM